MLDTDPTQPLTITATSAPGGRCRLAVAGELDLTSAGSLGSQIGTELEAGHDVELELSGVSFIDSSGIRVLVQALGQAAAAGRGFALCRPLPRQMHRVLEVAGLLDRFAFVAGPQTL